MNITDIPLDALINIVSDIANAAAESDLDVSATLDLDIATAAALRAANRQNDAYLLLAAFELCPMHECDAEICLDDQIAECATLRKECGLR